MSRRTTPILKAALAMIRMSGLDRLLGPLMRGDGVIFMLHQVAREAPQSFEPNRILKVTPQFIETVIGEMRDRGFDIVTLDEAHRRLARPRPGDGRFACFTFDDGYRDNLELAYPIFARHAAPFAVYVTPDFSDHRGELWWLALERALAELDEVRIELPGGARTWRTTSVDEKTAAYHRIYWRLRQMPEDDARGIVRELAARIGLGPHELSRELIMSWNELRTLARDPLVTIGAHTLSHRAVARLPAEVAWREIVGSVRRIESELGRPCRHFSYPYGDAASAGPRDFRIAAQAGLLTAVTTEKDHVRAGHRDCLLALPRVSLNGDYQAKVYLDALMSGVPFAIRNAARPFLRRPERPRGERPTLSLRA